MLTEIGNNSPQEKEKMNDAATGRVIKGTRLLSINSAYSLLPLPLHPARAI
jgi:hypothetical protein